MNTQIHKLIPAGQYHADPRLNNSAIKWLLKSPAHYQAYLAESREPTKAMQIGSAVLEPHLFEAEYIAMPDGLDRRTTEGQGRVCRDGSQRQNPTVCRGLRKRFENLQNRQNA